MKHAIKSPIFLFDESASTGIDRCPDDSIAFVLDGVTVVGTKAYRSFQVLTTIGTTPTTTIKDFLDNFPTQYEELKSPKGLRLDVVLDLVELKALVADNNSKTTVISTGDTYVYREVTVPKTGIVSDDGKGEWLLATNKIYMFTVIAGQTDFDTVHSEPLNIDFLDVYINGAYQNDRSLYNIVAPLNKIVKINGLTRKTEVRLIARSRVN